MERNFIRIALVGKDAEMIGGVRSDLDFFGYISMQFSGISDFLMRFHQGLRFDLLVLGIKEKTGLHELLTASKIPVLFLVASDELSLLSVVNDFSSGNSIDFIVNPMQSRQEIDARIHALVLRKNAKQKFNRGIEDLICEGYHFSIRERVVFYKNAKINLKPKEFEVALYIFENIGEVSLRVDMGEKIWGIEPSHELRMLNTCISGIRRKLSLDGRNGLSLNSVYGRGYRLSAPSILPLAPTGS